MGFMALIISVLLAAVWSAIDGSNILPYPRGPRSYPILGNLGFMSRLSRNADGELLELAHKYGAICMLWLGSNPILVINTAKAAHELMEMRGTVYASRPTLNNFRALIWPWRLVVTPVGDTFTLLRKIYHKLLGPQQSARFRKYQDHESKVLVGNLLDNPERFLKDTERFSLSVIFSAVYGIRLAQLDNPIMLEFYSVWEIMLQYFQPGSLLVDYLPCLQRLPRFLQPWLNLAEKLRVREMKLHKRIFQSLKEQVRIGLGPDCFGKTLIDVQEKEDIGDDEALHILAMLVGAGSETTSSVLQSFFKIMALHPEVIKKAHLELDHIVGFKRMPDWADEPSLPYIRALIKEVHRWAPIGSLGVPHATTKDDVYEGQLIPEGTIVFPNLMALNRDGDCYTDSETFDPDRFLEDKLDAFASASSSDHFKRDHFHYGFGRRLCQGIFVAEASLYIVISRVIWGFDITCHLDHKLDMATKTSGLVTKPKPYKVTIKSRSELHKSIMKRNLSNSHVEVLDLNDIKQV